MAARLTAEHPDYWPETIRAMMVHSAEWTTPMLAALGDTPGKRARYELVRRFGYGVPSFERANAFMNDQPYRNGRRFANSRDERAARTMTGASIFPFDE